MPTLPEIFLRNRGLSRSIDEEFLASAIILLGNNPVGLAVDSLLEVPQFRTAYMAYASKCICVVFVLGGITRDMRSKHRHVGIWC
jgi:hypothetical protein